MSRKKIHTRTITIDVYDEGDGTFTMEGNLQDVQPEDSGYFIRGTRKNDPRPMGVMHGMTTKLRVNRETSQIVNTEGEFPHTPFNGCEMAINTLSRLEGLKIGPGYNAKSRELVGGPQGCLHMNTLLTAMASSKNVAGAYYMREDRQAQVKRSLQMLEKEGKIPGITDSCHMWRSGGPLETHMRAEAAAFEKEGKL